MTVTIEVANQAGGVGSVKRTFLRSENFARSEDLEAAVIQFIRDSRAANEEALECYLPATDAQGSPSEVHGGGH